MPENPQQTRTDAELIEMLTKIRERLFWLQAVFASSLSSDVFMEAERYRRTFRELGNELKNRDSVAFEAIVSGHEALLLSEPVAQLRPQIPLAVQQLAELIAQAPRPTPQPKHPAGYVADGLQTFL